MTEITPVPSLAARVASASPDWMARRASGLSDRSIAWLFIAPTVVLLLAINIFPLIWTIRLSFTNYRANRPNAPLLSVGIDHYQSILSDPDIWAAMQATAHFVVWTIVLQTLLGFALAYLIDRKFRGHALWTTIILIPMMLSPAVVGNFWRFLYQPQIGLFNYLVAFVSGVPPSSFEMIGSSEARAVGDHPGRHLDVDTLCRPYHPRGAARSPTTSTRRPRSTVPLSGGSSGR
jgi:multiple sugar transport system permease protein